MRHSLRVPLDDQRTAIVHEITVRDARQLISQYADPQALEFKTLFTDGSVDQFLKNHVTLPDGESLDNLTGSECEKLLEGIMTVNASFFRLAGLATSNQAKPAEQAL